MEEKPFFSTETKKKNNPLKTLILLDVSGSYKGSPPFVTALKQIEAKLYARGKKNFEIHIFAKNTQKLTDDDIYKLIEAYTKENNHCRDIERKIENTLGWETCLEPILDLLQRKAFYCFNKLIIYSDLIFQDNNRSR